MHYTRVYSYGIRTQEQDSTIRNHGYSSRRQHLCKLTESFQSLPQRVRIRAKTIEESLCRVRLVLLEESGAVPSKQGKHDVGPAVAAASAQTFVVALIASDRSRLLTLAAARSSANAPNGQRWEAYRLVVVCWWPIALRVSGRCP